MWMSAFLLLLAIVTSPEAAARSALEAELHQAIDDYYYAIGEHRLDEALSVYHTGSPQLNSIRQELAYGQSAYLQRTSILSVKLLRHEGQQAVLRTTHRHLRIHGIKFMESFTQAEYTFRRQADAWKIWLSTERRMNRPTAPD